MANSKRQLFSESRPCAFRTKLPRFNAGRLSSLRSPLEQNISAQFDRRRKRGHTGNRHTMEKEPGCLLAKTTSTAATKVGSAIAERAQKAGVQEAIF